MFVGGLLLVLLNALTGDPVRGARAGPGKGLSAVGIVVTSLYAVVIAPFGEELFFRGVLFRSLRDRYGFRIGRSAPRSGSG